MTGEKSRFKTHEKLWNIDDKTLTTPEHDRMVIDLLNIEYLMQLIPELKTDFNKAPSHKYNNDNRFLEILKASYHNAGNLRDEDVLELTNNLIDGILKAPPGGTDPKESEMRESVARHYHISQHNLDKYIRAPELYQELHNIILTQDRAAAKEANQSVSEFLRWKTDPKARYQILLENPIKNGHFIIGYWDVVVQPLEYPGDFFTMGYEIDRPAIYIEVKPTIRSFGETLRQIKTYQEYLGGRRSITCLYTPDTKLDSAFESQGIRILHPGTQNPQAGEAST